LNSRTGFSLAGNFTVDDQSAADSCLPSADPTENDGPNSPARQATIAATETAHKRQFMAMLLEEVSGNTGDYKPPWMTGAISYGL
jgi:hypothetical protein